MASGESETKGQDDKNDSFLTLRGKKTVNCVVAIEGRFVLCDGKPASSHLTYEKFWRRYLAVFDTVTVVGRLFREEHSGVYPVEGLGVSFHPLPAYSGPLQYLTHYGELKEQINALNLSDAAIILRIPGAIGSAIWRKAVRAKHPYGVEVVGDPQDVFAPGAMRHPLRPLFQCWFSRQLRSQCANAIATAYVTESALQRRYSPNPDAFQTHYSSVELPASAFAQQSRNYAQVPQRPIRLIAVGTMEQMYKGFDVLIDAAAQCVRRDVDLLLILVGDGKYRDGLMRLAQQKGISDRVEFTGRLPAGNPIRKQLDAADAFVLASRQEGLPRAMIEAMARGLPCIGSTVGGIPELLPSEDMVPPGNSPALAAKIVEVLHDPKRMAAMSRRNWEKVTEYRDDVLRERRNAFYCYVKGMTLQWLNTQGR